MENFVVSARKYRPITFDTVVGQNSITSTLKNAIKNNHLAQAFLFCGPRGVGKTTCARILAKTINCENKSESLEACDKCESCTSFNNSASFNIHELDAASNNSVDDIRNLVEQVRIPPQVGRYKVYIIDEVHMLSTAAFNAFLKTLEEPPAYAKFILATTEKHKIIPTILSRCQIFDFKRISIDDIVKHLAFIAKNENIDTEADGLHIIAQKADGALRDALSIFDQIVSFSGSNITYKNVIENLNVLDYDYYFKIQDAILANNISEVLLLINEIIENGFDGQHFIIGLGEHLRNLLVCKNPETLSLLEVGDNIREKYAAQSQASDLRLILNSLDINNKCDINYKASNNKRLHLELSLLQMCALSKSIESAAGKTHPVQDSKKKVEPKSIVKEVPSQQTKQLQNSEAKTIDSEPTTIADESPKIEAQSSSTNSQSAEQKPTQTEQKPNQSVSPQAEEPKAEYTPDKEQQKEVASIKKLDSKPNIRIPGSVSIKNFTVKQEEDLKEELKIQKSIASGPAKDFTQAELEQQWEVYLKSISLQQRGFSYSLLKYKPELKENYIVEFKTDNKVLAADRNNIMQLQAFLKKELKNSKLSLKVIILEKDESKKAYTDLEKYQKMIERNPNIKSLKEQLDLEIDF